VGGIEGLFTTKKKQSKCVVSAVFIPLKTTRGGSQNRKMTKGPRFSLRQRGKETRMDRGKNRRGGGKAGLQHERLKQVKL